MTRKEQREARIEELEAIEQPLEVIEAGNGGDFGIEEFHELLTLRAVRNVQRIIATPTNQLKETKT